MNKVPLVINLFGAPGAGKSTGAAYIFSELKQRGVNAELVTEFAKDKTWEGNTLALSCQEYVFGKQSYRLARCRDDVDVIITDSPLPLAIIYNTNPALGQPFNEVILSVFDTYDNVNFFIKRGKAYNPKGRNQTEAESDALAEDILHMLDYHRIDYGIVEGDMDGYDYILSTAVYELTKKGVNIYV
jgi:hypothetical protein